MSRYSVEYNPNISQGSKDFIIKNIEPELKGEDTAVYNLDHILNLNWVGRAKDHEYLKSMAEDEEIPPDYIEF